MDNFQSFLVVLDGSNEELVAVALVVKKNLNFSIDFVLSKFVPSNVVLGGNKFLFESNSVLLRCNEEFLVKILNFGEFGDSSSSNQFVSFILSVSGELGIEVGLLKILQ
jgi:hypothetical protein